MSEALSSLTIPYALCGVVALFLLFILARRRPLIGITIVQVLLALLPDDVRLGSASGESLLSIAPETFCLLAVTCALLTRPDTKSTLFQAARDCAPLFICLALAATVSWAANGYPADTTRFICHLPLWMLYLTSFSAVLAIERTRIKSFMLIWLFVASAACIAFSGLYLGAGEMAGIGGLGNRNAVSYYAAAASLFWIVGLLQSRAIRNNLWFAAIVSTMIISTLGMIAISGSRGTLVSFVLGMLSLAFRPGRLARQRISILLLLAVVVLVGVSQDYSRARIKTLLVTDIRTIQMHRWRMAVVALRMAQAKPLTGIGAGRFGTLAPEYNLDFEKGTVRSPCVTENDYLEALAELGAPGLLIILVTLGICGNRLRRLALQKNNRVVREPWIADALLAMFVFLVIAMCFDNFLAAGQGWVFVTPLYAFIMHMRISHEAIPRPVRVETCVGGPRRWGFVYGRKLCRPYLPAVPSIGTCGFPHTDDRMSGWSRH